MSYVDEMFIENARDILKEEWEVDNRAKWEDGSPVKTKRILQVVNKYDLSKGFPILNLRNINYEIAIDEILCFYVKLSNNIKDMKGHIWDSWANEKGEIKKAYGYQIARPTMGFESQMHYVINQIKTNPTSRRIMMSMFNADDQLTKAKESLIECAYTLHFSVKDSKLHTSLIQRSGDFLSACGSGQFNVVQYSALIHAVAMECDLEVGVFTHFIQDLHIYNKHVPQIEELISRQELVEDIKLPTLKVKKKPFFELTVDDFELIGYEPLNGIGKIEVAI